MAYPLTEHAADLLKAAGFQELELIEEYYDARSFGNQIAVFRIGGLVLRFIRDRGHDSVDLGSAAFPDRLHFLGDVRVAFGQTSMEDYVSSDIEVRSLEEQLKLIFEDFERLEQAFSPERAPKTLALVEEVVKESARRNVERLRKLGAAGVRLPPERKPGPKDGTPS
mgnify:CR=1 FL=1